MKRLLLALMIFAVPAFSAHYYVKNGGNNSASGLSDALAWRTVGWVNASSFSPGDTISFKRGDTWTDAGLIFPSSGTSGSWITVDDYSTGDLPIIDGVGNGIAATSKSYVRFVRINTTNCSKFAELTNCNNILLYGCTGTNASAWAAVDIINSRSVTIRQCTYDRSDTTYATHGGNGDIIDIDANSRLCLVDSCTLTRSSHSTVSLYGDSSIVRDCYVYNTHGYLDAKGEHNIFLRNIITKFDLIADPNRGAHGIQISGSYNLFRYNLSYCDTSQQDGVATVTSFNDMFTDFSDASSHNRLAFNTMLGMQDAAGTIGTYGKVIWISSNDDALEDMMEDNQFKNNIMAYPWNGDTYHACVRWNDPAKNASEWNDVWDGNLFYGGTDVVMVKSTNYSNAGAKSAFPNVWKSGNIEVDPMFTDTLSSDFTLQATSPAIDAGVSLTLANGGATSTSLTVDDASWFTTGWGLIPADSIKVGSGNAVGISSISGNTITLTSSRTWSDNDEVFLWSGKIVDDMGAFQYSGAAPPLAPSAPTITLSALGKHGFTLTWVAIDSVAGYKLDIATDAAFTSYVSGYEAKAVVDTSLVVSDLSRGQTVWVRARAYNGNGESDNSSSVSATTFRNLRGHR